MPEEIVTEESELIGLKTVEQREDFQNSLSSENFNLRPFERNLGYYTGSTVSFSLYFYYPYY
jgi:hypothetical protein